MIEAIFFYILAFVLLSASLAVVVARNPVHSVLFLVLAFFNAAGLFVLLGAELIAMTLMIVYVGAIAVLFLFVVMMLSTRASLLSRKKHAVACLVLGGTLALEFLGLGILSAVIPVEFQSFHAHSAPNSLPNALAIGQVLYTHYAYVFQIAGLVLLVAVIGAIVLCHDDQPHNGASSSRATAAEPLVDTSSSVRLVHAPIGKGVRS